MESEHVELLHVHCRETLERDAISELVERISWRAAAAVQKVARVRRLTIVGDIREPAIDRKICGW